jgi:hypothetical protein
MAKNDKRGRKVKVGSIKKKGAAKQIDASDLKHVRGGDGSSNQKSGRWKILQDTQTKIFEIQQEAKE